MKPLFALLALLALATPALAESLDAQISFSTPAYFDGAGLQASGYAVIPTSSISFAGSGMQVTEIQSAAASSQGVVLSMPPQAESHEFDQGAFEHGWVEATGDGWMMIHFNGCDITGLDRLELRGAFPMDAKGAASWSMPAFPAARIPPSSEDGFVAGGWQSAEQSWQCNSVSAEIYGLAGEFGDATPQSFETGRSQGVEAPAENIRGSTHVHYRFIASKVVMQLSAADEAYAVLDELTPTWNGTASLPLAEVSRGPQPLANGTLILDGDFTMREFQPDGTRFRGQLEGDAQAVFVDGVPTILSESSLRIASTTIAVAMLALVAKYAYSAALFTRLPADEALKHPRRQQLKEYIFEHPGATFRELCRATNIPTGTCRHHLSVMARSEIIVEHGHRSTTRFFENHGKFDKSWEKIVMLREPELEKVHGFVESNPGAMQKVVLDHAANEWGWSRSTTQHRLQRLVENGVLAIQEIGRRKEYFVAELKRPDPLARFAT